MPRTSRKAKQTRLAFAPADPADDETPDKDGRFARLAYGHPSKATVRPEKSQSSQPKSTKKRPSKPSTRNKDAEQPESRSVKKEASPKPKDEDQDQLFIQDNPDNSSDDIVAPSSQRRKQHAHPLVEAVIPSPSKPVKSKPAEEPIDSDNSVEEVPRPRRKLKRKAESSPITLSDSEESEEPLLSSPAKRRRPVQSPQTPQTPRSSAARDELDLEEDLKDLQDSVVKKGRTRGRVAESARDKRLRHLETLRRRRAGLKEESEEEPDAEPEQAESDASSTERHVEPSPVPSNEDLDRYEEDFVLEDEDDGLGVPTEEIPFEFTRHAYKQPKEYFRDVVGWMVHNRLNPAFPRSDALYEMAFMKLEDEVKGRAGSQLISSVWNAGFRRALLARPHMEITAFPTEENHPCDACNRSGHPASTDMKLYGKAYSLQTLEPLRDEDSSEEQSDEGDSDSMQERDRDGHVLPDESTRFFLGRQCKAKAQLAHTLTHWRYHLNEWVTDYLERKGQMKDDEILKRNDMSTKRRTRHANAVLDSMVAAGEISKLWHDFHLNLKSARETTSTLG